MRTAQVPLAKRKGFGAVAAARHRAPAASATARIVEKQLTAICGFANPKVPCADDEQFDRGAGDGRQRGWERGSGGSRNTAILTEGKPGWVFVGEAVEGRGVAREDCLAFGDRPRGSSDRVAQNGGVVELGVPDKRAGCEKSAFGDP